MSQKLLLWVAALLAVVAVGSGGVYWWQQQAPTPVAPPPAVAQAAPAAPAAPAPAERTPPPAILHPIEPDNAASAAPPPRPLPPPDQAEAYVADALTDLLGRKAVLTFLSTDGFAARLVATVDNLDRPLASPQRWPVNPSPGRFQTTPTADGTLIGADNAKRYAPFVQFVASADSARAVALYRRLYPLFQAAYEELGYPGKYFNDRLVQVIDHLLQTPEPAGPPKVRLTEVKGPIPSATPWLRYEFEDPALEARSAGQKLLLRMGPAHSRQLKAKLAEVRALIARR
ncbi:MAG: hypothetical protein AD742_19695 [Methylibium sp. NZG]|nr:MAG: hypothetical protein AD742_19695 [Methylibium sp. NZG]